MIEELESDSGKELLKLSCSKLVQQIAHLVHGYARIKHHIFMINSSASLTRSRWRELFTHQRRKAIIECLRAVPFFKLKKYFLPPLLSSIYSPLFFPSLKDLVFMCVFFGCVCVFFFCRHRAVNMFLQEYSSTWLLNCKQTSLNALCERLLVSLE